MTYTLITGACGGLGGAFVQLLASRGTALFLTGRSEARLALLASSLKERYPALPVRWFACDLTNERERAALFSYAEGKNICISRLIYVAGVDIQKPFLEYTMQKVILQTRVNFEGAVSFAHAFLAQADRGGQAELLVVGSVSGWYPMPYFALYSATKRALEQFFSALHVECRGRAKVTCVLPGAIPTRPDICENIRLQGVWGKLSALPAEEVARRSLKALAKNRRTVVIGFYNKLMRLLTGWMPLSWKLRFIAHRWSKMSKDAF